MGRYIHADDYENTVIYKYWFGKQSSELGRIILPFGAKNIKISTPEDQWDEYLVSNEIYQKMKEEVFELCQLLSPNVRIPDQ